MKILLFLLISFSAYPQIAVPTYNPFNNGGVPFYGQNQIRPQNSYYQQRPNNNYYNNNFFSRPQFPNNFNRPSNFSQPNNFAFGRPNVNPNYQQQFSPQVRPQQFPQQNWQQPQTQPQQPQTQPQQPTSPTIFTRRFHLNNGYLFGRPTLYLDPKTGKMQPWIRKNLR